jgi:hypothetical protein
MSNVEVKVKEIWSIDSWSLFKITPSNNQLTDQKDSQIGRSKIEEQENKKTGVSIVSRRKRVPIIHRR